MIIIYHRIYTHWKCQMEQKIIEVIGMRFELMLISFRDLEVPSASTTQPTPSI